MENDWETALQYMPIVRHVAWRKKLDYDDTNVWHCGLDILLRCVRSYQPGKGKLSTYITGALWRSLNDNETARREFPGYRREFEVDYEPEREAADLVSLLKGRLDAYDWHLLDLYFFHYLTYDQIGLIVGLSKSQVHRHMQDALLAARKLLMYTASSESLEQLGRMLSSGLPNHS